MATPGALGWIDCPIADVTDLHIAANRAILDKEPWGAAKLTRPLTVSDKAALVDPHRMVDFIDLDAVDIWHAGIAQRQHCEPAVAMRPAWTTATSQDHLVAERRTASSWIHTRD